MIRAALISSIMAVPVVAETAPQAAMRAFNSLCFKAGQTEAQIRNRMEMQAGTPLPFDLTFWDTSLEPAPSAPKAIERRCEVTFDGDHTETAITVLRTQMATPPVFGTVIDLPDTHRAETGTALIEGRALLRGRVAVVHVGIRNTRTFMSVDRLPFGWEVH